MTENLPPPVRKVGDAWRLEWHSRDMYERDARGIPIRLKDGVPASGLYVRDRETFTAMARDPRMQALRELDFSLRDRRDPAIYGGITVRVATAAEWVWFERREIDELAEFFGKQEA